MVAFLSQAYFWCLCDFLSQLLLTIHAFGSHVCFISFSVARQFCMAPADSGGLVLGGIQNKFLWASRAKFIGIVHISSVGDIGHLSDCSGKCVLGYRQWFYLDVWNEWFGVCLVTQELHC